MKKKLIYIAVIFIFSLSVIAGLHLTSIAASRHNNGFVRHAKNNLVVLKKIQKLSATGFRIAGISGNNVYLSQEKDPFKVIVIDQATEKLVTKNIINKTGRKIRAGLLRVDPPYIYVSDPYSTWSFIGSLNNLQLERGLLNDRTYDFVIPLTPSTFAIRVFDKKNITYQLGKKSGDSAVRIIPALLEKQSEGTFSVDGRLQYNKELNILTYVYWYRNQFICLDTNFNLLYKGQTIDTNTVAKIKVAKVMSDHVLTMSEPPPVINKKSTSNGNYLFIESTLKGDNELQRIFNKSSVIDVYNLENGSYHTSFYIDRYKSGRIGDFQVTGNKLYIVSDDYLLTYEFNKGI